MAILALSKKKFAPVVKKAAVVSVLPLALITNAYADAPSVTEVVSDIDALEGPLALVGGAYIGLKVFKRGWQIIKGFI